VVLDASALLAYLRDEPGAQAVSDAIAAGATISAVNLAEVFSTVAGRGADPASLAAELTDAGLLGGALIVEDFTTQDAIAVAQLRPPTAPGRASPGWTSTPDRSASTPDSRGCPRTAEPTRRASMPRGPRQRGR